MPKKNHQSTAEAIVIDLAQVPTTLLNLVTALGTKTGLLDEAEHAAADTSPSQGHQEENEAPGGEEVPAEPSKPAEEHTAAEENFSGHEPGCPMIHVEERRQRAWAICDEAFPQDPHLWSALEVLLLAAEGFQPADRTAQLATAVTHIEHHLQTVPEPTPSPVSGLIAFINGLGK